MQDLTNLSLHKARTFHFFISVELFPKRLSFQSPVEFPRGKNTSSVTLEVKNTKPSTREVPLVLHSDTELKIASSSLPVFRTSSSERIGK